MGALRGKQVQLEDESLVRLETELAQILGESDVRVAFYVGVHGAHQKLIAQVMTLSGEILAYAKIGVPPRAKAAVEGEHRVLLRLSESEVLRGKVPEVLGHFDWQEGKVLLMTSAPKRSGPGQLTGVHAKFCETVFSSFAQECVFGEGPIWARMTETVHRLNSVFPDPMPAYYNRALQLLGDELGSVHVPLSLAHRDFAPWNTRLGPSGLFVLDWEHAEEGVPPLYDAFHFWAIQAAIFERRRHPPDRAFLKDLLSRLWPGAQKHLRWLYLVYLVDMSLFYGEAQVIAPDVSEQHVWRWFAEQIKGCLEEGAPL
jgi:hypothetical protein